MAIATGLNTDIPKHQMFDKLLELRDASFAAETAASADRATFVVEHPEVATVVTPLDLGPGRYIGKVIIDISDFDSASGDEEVEFVVLGWSDAAGTKKVPLASLRLGAAATHPGTETLAAPSRREIQFSNDEAGEVFPLITLGVVLIGTTPSLDFTAYVARNK